MVLTWKQLIIIVIIIIIIIDLQEVGLEACYGSDYVCTTSQYFSG
jgi:hypothetical protein